MALRSGDDEPGINAFTCETLSPSFATAFPSISTCLSASVAPKNYKAALASEDWESKWAPAVQKELGVMEKYGVFQVVPREDWMKVLRAAWVFRVKEDGTAKARLVADGGRQREGVDYDETASQVVHKDTLRMVLALVNYLDLECDTVDVKAAFLNGKIDTEIFLNPPEGSGIPFSHVVRLVKALYGLKQSNRIFNRDIDAWLLSVGFSSLEADSCVYVRTRGPSFVLISLHVDDELVAANTRAALDEFKAEFRTKYDITDNGPVTTFLGIEVIRDRTQRKMWLCLERFTRDLVARFGMADANTVKSPTIPKLVLSSPSDDEHASVKDFPYRDLVGSLLYLVSICRPDIAHVASLLARFSSKWGPEHVLAGKHVLRYLKGTADFALLFDGNSQMVPVEGWADADWGGDRDTKRSTTGYVFKTLGGVTSWKSKLQPTVALSTMEAEVMASSEAARQSIYVAKLLRELSSLLPPSVLPSPPAPTTLYNDNMGAVEFSKNDVFHDRSKHIDRRQHFVREKVASGDIRLVHVPTDANVADGFTKPLGPVNHPRTLLSLGVEQRPAHGGARESGFPSSPFS